MSDHYIATDAERFEDCEECSGQGERRFHFKPGEPSAAFTCDDCDGSGRVLREGIDPKAEPEILVHIENGVWGWRIERADSVAELYGYDTEVLALAAARKALG